MSQLQLSVLLALLCVSALAWKGYRPYVDECRGRVRQSVAAFLLIAILAVAVFYPVTSFGEAEDIDPALLSFPSLLAGHLLLASFLAGWWGLSQTRLAALLHLRCRGVWNKVRRGLLVGAGGWIATVAVTAAAAGVAGWVGGAHPASSPPPLMLWLADLPLLDKLAVVAAAMTVEEAFFRAFLQSRFGLLLSTVLFTLSHFSYGLPFMIVGVFTISLIIGWAFERTGDLLPCIVAHGVFDGVQLLLVLPWAVRMWSAGLA